MDWHQVKEWLSAWTALHMDALHVHAGVMGQILAALLLRRSLADALPWAAVLVVTLANEGFDLAYEVWPTRDQQIAESVKDVWNTMMLPTLLLLLARYTPELFGRGRV